MKKYIKLIQNSKLFYNFSEQEIELALNCLSAVKRTYKKGEFIYRVGDIINSIGLIIEGSIHIEKEDFWGNESILIEVSSGEIFGESYAYIDSQPIPINVISSSNSIILFLNIKKIFNPCNFSCPFHIKIIQNLVSVLANKNKAIISKLEHISQRTTRNKILSYLSEQAIKNKSSSFYIPFDRQQLADYLSVNRSAMSNELSKMKAEGILDFDKNYFNLKS